MGQLVNVTVKEEPKKETKPRLRGPKVPPPSRRKARRKTAHESRRRNRGK